MTMPRSIPFSCPDCFSHVGRIIEIDGQMWLDSGGWLISSGRRVCHACGREVYWSRPKKNMDELEQAHLERSKLDWTDIMNRKTPPPGVFDPGEKS